MYEIHKGNKRYWFESVKKLAENLAENYIDGRYIIDDYLLGLKLEKKKENELRHFFSILILELYSFAKNDEITALPDYMFELLVTFIYPHALIAEKGEWQKFFKGKECQFFKLWQS